MSLKKLLSVGDLALVGNFEKINNIKNGWFKEWQIKGAKPLNSIDYKK